MAIQYYEYKKIGTKQNYTFQGGIVSIIGKSQPYDSNDTSKLYIINKASLANNEVVTTGWIDVEEFDSFYLIAKSTDTGNIKIEFSDEGNDNEVSDGDSISLSSSSFAKIGGVSANAGELAGDINYKFAKITYTATGTAEGKPLKVKILVIR